MGPSFAAVSCADAVDATLTTIATPKPSVSIFIMTSALCASAPLRPLLPPRPRLGRTSRRPHFLPRDRSLGDGPVRVVGRRRLKEEAIADEPVEALLRAVASAPDAERPELIVDDIAVGFVDVERA